MLAGVIPIPSVPLRVIARRNFRDDFVCLYVLVREFGSLLPWPLQTVLLLVCNGTTILTSTFAVLLGCWTGFGTTIIPIVEFLRWTIGVRSTLMVQRGRACVEIPWSLRNVLCGNCEDPVYAEVQC